MNLKNINIFIASNISGVNLKCQIIDYLKDMGVIRVSDAGIINSGTINTIILQKARPNYIFDSRTICILITSKICNIVPEIELTSNLIVSECSIKGIISLTQKRKNADVLVVPENSISIDTLLEIIDSNLMINFEIL